MGAAGVGYRLPRRSSARSRASERAVYTVLCLNVKRTSRYCPPARRGGARWEISLFSPARWVTTAALLSAPFLSSSSRQSRRLAVSARCTCTGAPLRSIWCAPIAAGSIVARARGSSSREIEARMTRAKCGSPSADWWTPRDSALSGGVARIDLSSKSRGTVAIERPYGINVSAGRERIFK